MDNVYKPFLSLSQLLADVCFGTSFWMVTGQDGITLRTSWITSIRCCGVKPTTLDIRFTSPKAWEQVRILKKTTITYSNSVLFNLDNVPVWIINLIHPEAVSAVNWNHKELCIILLFYFHSVKRIHLVLEPIDCFLGFRLNVN